MWSLIWTWRKCFCSTCSIHLIWYFIQLTIFYMFWQVTADLANREAAVLALSNIQKNGVCMSVWRDIPYWSMPDNLSWSEYVSSHTLSVLPDTEGRSCPRSRCKHSACLKGNSAYIFGGKDGNVALSDTWLFDIGMSNFHLQFCQVSAVLEIFCWIYVLLKWMRVISICMYLQSKGNQNSIRFSK